MLDFLRVSFDLPDEVLYRIGIYADGTNLYPSLGKSVFFEKVESAGELELDLHSILEWGDRWLVTFNATKTKLLSFNHNKDPLGACGDEWHRVASRDFFSFAWQQNINIIK